MWEGSSPGAYDATRDAAANNDIKGMNDSSCKPN